MKPIKTISLTPTSDNLISAIQQHARVLDGNVSFGSGQPNDTSQNIQGKMVVGIVTPGTANTEFAVSHNLGYVPVGFQLVRSSAAASVYDSGTPWTTSQIFLKCSGTSTTITVFAF